MDLAPDTTLSAEEREHIVKRMQAITRLLDNAVRIPIINYRIGLDPILGLIPVLGGAISTAISSYTLWGAHKLGHSKVTLLKMMVNLLVDWAIGTVPIAGDIIDFFLKANQRNLRMLNLDEEEEALALNAEDHADTSTTDEENSADE